MNTLIAEILTSLIGAGVLGLLCGWMIKSAAVKQTMAKANENFNNQYNTLDARTQQDIEHLEDQLQQMGGELKSLTASNRSLNEALRQNEGAVYKSRTDAIELNRQQAETQERLQRIIMEKDEEIKLLKSSSASAVLSKAAAQSSTKVDNTLAAKRQAWEKSQQATETEAEEHLDQTIRIDDELLGKLPGNKSKKKTKDHT